MSSPVTSSFYRWLCCSSAVEQDLDTPHIQEPIENSHQTTLQTNNHSKNNSVQFDDIRAFELQALLLSEEFAFIQKISKKEISTLDDLKKLSPEELFEIFTHDPNEWPKTECLCLYLLGEELKPARLSEEDRIKGGKVLIAMILDRKIHHAELLLKLGVESNFVLNDTEFLPHAKGSSPIHFAVQKRNGKMVQLLLNYKASINKLGAGGATPLCFACGFGQKDYKENLKMVQLLIDKGASLSLRAGNGDAPIHTAAEKGFSETVVLLTANGADPESIGRQGVTARVLVALKQDLQNVPLPGQLN